MTGSISPGRRLGRRRRANVDGGRRGDHRVKVSSEEETILQRMAAEQNVTVPRLLVESALSGGRETSSERRAAMAELFAVHRLLAAISNNVNQVARHANAGEEFPRDAAATLTAVRKIAERIERTLDELGAGR